MKIARERHIHDRPRGKHLIPIFTSSLNIRRGSRNRSLSFIVLNVKNRGTRFILRQQGDTYCFFVSMNELDGRIIKKVYQNNIKVRGAAVFGKWINIIRLWKAENANGCGRIKMQPVRCRNHYPR